MMTPESPEFGPADPALFAPLTDDENSVLRMHLTSGWYKQHVVWPTLSDIWRETSEVLDDIHAAWQIAFDARQRARATCRTCGARGADVDVENVTAPTAEDGAGDAAWQCTDRQACAARLAPSTGRVLATTAGGAR